MKKNKIVTFGEIMLRLTPPEYHTISDANSFQATYGGGEANVAVSLAKFGHLSYFVSRLPNNELGDSAIRYLKGHDVSTRFVDRGGTNIGIYFLEQGFGGRASKVLYNRKYAAITSIHSDKFDFDEIFNNASWFHFSGITLALGENVRTVLIEMLKAAKKNKVTVSFDCNYRQTLWTTKEAAPHFQEILPYIDICFASAFDGEQLFGIERNNDLKSREEQDLEIFKKLLKKSKIRKIFGTKREIFSATDNSLSAYCITKDNEYYTKPSRFNIYDRIGGGDAFVSGVVHGILKDPDNLDFSLEFGLATSVLKHTIWGDAFRLSEEDVIFYMANKTGSVIR